eukprot:406021_1
MDAAIQVDSINPKKVYQPSPTRVEGSSKSQSGYNIELFVNHEAANKYLCAICHHVVSDCHETTCGHIFCGGCISRVLDGNHSHSNNVGFKCPWCKQINSRLPHKSTYLNRAVKNLRVKCPFHHSGCKWIGCLSDLMVSAETANNSNNHLMKCQYAPVTCDECGHRICRAEFEMHRKQCTKSCTNCGITFNTTNDRKHHYQKCPVMVQCKHCKQKIKKSELNHHVSFLCSLRLIKCPFYHFGCHQVIKSLNLTNHLKYNSAQHYQLKVDDCINKIEKMKLQMESLLKINNDTNLKQNSLQKQNESLTKQLIEMKSKMKLHQMYNHKPLQPLAMDNSNNVNANNNTTTTITAHAAEILLLIGSNKWEETGVFIRRSELHQGRVCYTSLRTRCAIRWNSELLAWLIDRRGLASDNEASLIAYQDVAHPGLVTVDWLVYNDDIQDWQQSPNYRIQSYNLAEFIFKADQIFASCSNHKLLNINSKLTQQPSLSNTTSTSGSPNMISQISESNDENIDINSSKTGLPPGLLSR